jgi:NMD protein affecting ribosome stability and mRNA decay
MSKKAGKGTLERAPHIVSRKTIDSGGADPYMNKEAPDDMALCRKCGAVYHEKRWYKRDDLPGKLAGAPNTELVHCPGCQKVTDKYAEGYLTIEGRFVKEHGDEILSIIDNKGDRQFHINPLEQIIEIKRSGGRIEVQTTTDMLAQRIGQTLQKAYDGELTYKWSGETKLARVIWSRD